MLLSLTLLFLYTGSSAAKKTGDFGIFTACLNQTQTLRLDCYYPDCSGSPSFYCEFMTSGGSQLANASDKQCNYFVPLNLTANYTCKLKRRERTEQKNISIDDTYRKQIKPCPATAGLQLHRAPTFLWPAVSLTLWGVLTTARQHEE